jgi:CRP/FNR family transcriptional regulator, nitrogen oxide reductase regulator
MNDFTSFRLFAGLGKPESRAILAAGVRRRFKAAETIIRAENPATHLFVVMSGKVNFYVGTEKGQQILLRRFVTGNAFGIASFLSEPFGYLGTASAIKEVEVLAWEHRDVIQLARTYPLFSQNAFRIALHYIEIYARRHISLVTDTAQERLASVLTGVASREGRLLPTGMEINIRNEDLASLADVGFYTASRLLKRWERTGAVVKSRGKVLIQCPEKLLAQEVAYPRPGTESYRPSKSSRSHIA